MNEKFEVDNLSASDFTSFGFCMSGRKFSTPCYRYGFNGKEKDDEINSEGNSYDFGARIYDGRLGRWMSCDDWESKYPMLSTYCFVGNSPIKFIDPDGKGIKAANNDAVVIMNAMFADFNTTIGGVEATGQELFRVSATTTGTFQSTASKEQFKENLKKSTLTKAQKKEAKALFKVLSSTDIVEIGLVEQKTTLQDPVIVSPTCTANTTPPPVVLTTENTASTKLLDENSRGEKTNVQIREDLLQQETSENLDESKNEAYGYFENKNKGMSGSAKGIILVNDNSTPAADFTFTFNNSTSNANTAKNAFKKAILKFSKSKEFKKFK